MKLRSLLLLVLLLLGALSAPMDAQTVVFIVRHAERAPGSGDVAISEEGRARAAALAELLKTASVSEVITTQYQRTKQTAEPLATAMGLTPSVVSAQSDIAKHAAEVAAAARQHTGKSVLVVGHSNTVPSIVAALGGPKFADLCEPEYDAVFTVIIDAGGATRVTKSRFGVPTPVDGSCASMR